MAGLINILELLQTSCISFFSFLGWGETGSTWFAGH
jgi:hypothetical protein